MANLETVTIPVNGREFGSKRLAVGIAGLMTLSSFGSTAAQEPSPNPSAAPELKPEFDPCATPALVEESPMPSMTPVVELSNGSTLVFESPVPSMTPKPLVSESPSPNQSPEQINQNAHKAFIEMLNNDPLKNCDFGILSENIVNFYEKEENSELNEQITEKYGSGPGVILENSYKELKKKKKKKRDSDTVAQGLFMLLDSYILTKNPEVLEYIRGYRGATNGKLNQIYFATEVLTIDIVKDILKSQEKKKKKV